MATYRLSGTAQTSNWLGDVSPLDDAVAGETGVEVENATRTADDGVEFTLRVEADDAESALAVGRRIGDRLSPGSGVTLLDA